MPDLILESLVIKILNDQVNAPSTGQPPVAGRVSPLRVLHGVPAWRVVERIAGPQHLGPNGATDVENEELVTAGFCELTIMELRSIARACGLDVAPHTHDRCLTRGPLLQLQPQKHS